MQAVAPSRPVEWIKSAFETVFKNPVAFLVMGLIYAILSIIPLINLITVLLMPALMAGMQHAARKQDAGQTAEIGDLFAAFQQPGKIGPMVLLVLPLLAIVIVMVVIMFVMVGGSMMAAMSGGDAAGGLAMGSMLLAFLLAIPLSLLAYATIFTSISRVFFDGIEPFAAVKESVQACIKNIVPLIVLMLLFLVVFIVGAIIMLIPILGAIIFICVIQPVSAIVLYRAYQDIFGVTGMIQHMPTGPSGPSGPFGPPSPPPPM